MCKQRCRADEVRLAWGPLCPGIDGRGPMAGRDTLTGLWTDRGMELESVSTLVVKFSVESKASGIGPSMGRFEVFVRVTRGVQK